MRLLGGAKDGGGAPRPCRRCVVVLDGWYEWKADALGEKQPYYVYAAGVDVLPEAYLD